MKYHATPIVTSIHRIGVNPIFGEGVTHVCLEDEAGGAFVVLKQFDTTSKEAEVRFDMDELEYIVTTARTMVNDYNLAIVEGTF
jgi:hypothetical protein